jgi:FlaA1/EpsC-like NDP-sugar epimerase
VWVSACLGVGFVATIAMRVSLRLLLRGLRKRGHNLRHIAIVGAGTLGRTIAERLRDAPWTGFHVVAFYDDDLEALAGVVLPTADDAAVEPIVRQTRVMSAAMARIAERRVANP